MSVLTKAKILAGKSYREEFYVEELGGSVNLRPLTEGEYSQAHGAFMTKFKISTNFDPTKVNSNAPQEMLRTIDYTGMNPAELITAQAEMEYQIAARGLSTDEEWTVDDVKQLPVGVPKKIARRVREITGTTQEEAAAAALFRGDQRGAVDAAAGHDRPSAGVESGGLDPAAK